MTRREYPVQEANGMVPDYQPAFWALDQLKACIGGTVPRSEEEKLACEDAKVALDAYFAAKDAIMAAPLA